MTNRSKKGKIAGISFVRAFCAIGIVIYHFSCYSAGSFHTLSLGSWDGILVSVFFVISGAMLSYNYPEISSYRTYFFKRWKSVFPSFYLCFVPLFLFSVIKQRKFFYLGSPAKLLYSAAGLDGYFLYKGDNYYIIGEWFLGAVIMLYLLYPLILILRRKNRLIMPGILLGLYLCMLYTPFFTVRPFRNLITCTSTFYAGTVLAEYLEIFQDSRKFAVFFSLLFLFLCFIPLPVPEVLATQLKGIILFIPLLRLGSSVMKHRVGKVFDAVAGVSYQIFLIQSRLIRKMAEIFNPVNLLSSAVYLVFTVVLIIFLSMLLAFAERKMLQSKIFRRLETKFTAG